MICQLPALFYMVVSILIRSHTLFSKIIKFQLRCWSNCRRNDRSTRVRKPKTVLSQISHISLSLYSSLPLSRSRSYTNSNSAVFTCGLRLAETAHALTKGGVGNGDHEAREGEHESGRVRVRVRGRAIALANYECVNIYAVAIERNGASKQPHPLLLLTNPNHE